MSAQTPYVGPGGSDSAPPMGLPGLGPDRKSGPARAAAAATPHGGIVARNAALQTRADGVTQRNLPAHDST